MVSLFSQRPWITSTIDNSRKKRPKPATTRTKKKKKM